MKHLDLEVFVKDLDKLFNDMQDKATEGSALVITAARVIEKQQAEIEALKAKTLTDEEILEIWRENERVYPMDRSRLLDRSRACIKKASEE